MKWIYIMVVLVIAASALGCVDKKQADSATETSAETPIQTSVSSGGSPDTSGANPSEVAQTPAPGEDVFGTYSDLSAMDNITSDLDMQIVLSAEI
ncbi:MAG: hypothetical protein OIN87_03460 [Candidatus Methanoperedens sp.]|nr:hypothetical protein [Candidatus Methanoperedens sp.]